MNHYKYGVMDVKWCARCIRPRKINVNDWTFIAYTQSDSAHIAYYYQNRTHNFSDLLRSKITDCTSRFDAMTLASNMRHVLATHETDYPVVIRWWDNSYEVIW